MNAAVRFRPLANMLVARNSRLIAPRGVLKQGFKPQLTQSFRRDIASGAAIPGPKPKKRFRILKNTWRLAWGSTFLGAGWLAYSIYETRFPQEQIEPDPAKKTLVILGMFSTNYYHNFQEKSRALISLFHLLGSGWGSVALLKKLDTENYNVVVISPRNFFLFTPLLPSCPTGTVEHRSIMEPLRHIIRHKKASVKFYEAEATKIDNERRVVVINDLSDVKGDVHQTEVPFDYLVVGVGAENATFGKW